MLTQCPNCGTIYQLAAADLSAAQGYVECGDCGSAFNALARLADEPKFAPAVPEAGLSPHAAESAPPLADAELMPPLADAEPVSSPAGAESMPSPVDAEPAPSQADAGPAPSPADSEPAPTIVLREHDVAPPPDPVAVSAAAADDEAAAFTPTTAAAATPPPASTDPTDIDPPVPEPVPVTSGLLAAGDEPMITDFTADADSAPLAAADAPDPTATARAVEESADSDAEIAAMAPLRPATSVLTEADHAILFTDPDPDPDPDPEPEPEPEPEPATADAAEALFDLDDVPEVIRRDVAALTQAPRRRWRWFWLVLALLLSALGFVQLAFVWRADIVAAVPATEPLFAAVCARIACAETPREPSAIELVARDVRDHPQYRDTLLVNATLVSRAAGPTPYPVIQLGLQGPTGALIGVRRFAPHEYLDKSIDIAAGMPPNRAVYIVLEVAQSGDRAASFEFSFL